MCQNVCSMQEAVFLCKKFAQSRICPPRTWAIFIVKVCQLLRGPCARWLAAGMNVCDYPGLCIKQTAQKSSPPPSYMRRPPPHIRGLNPPPPAPTYSGPKLHTAAIAVWGGGGGIKNAARPQKIVIKISFINYYIRVTISIMSLHSNWFSGKTTLQVECHKIFDICIWIYVGSSVLRCLR